MTIFQTSGTTGKPKTVLLSDEKMLGRVSTMDDTSRGNGFSALKSIFVDFPQSTIIGARYLQYGEAHKDVEIVFSSLGNVTATVAMLKDRKIQGIASTPSGLLNYAQVINGSYTFDWIMASTANLNAAMSKIIRAGLGENVWSSYACTEVGTISIASAAQIEAMHGCVGKIVPGINIKFIDGEIVVQSDTLIDGYHDNPGLTAQRFIDGWYYTGDLGHMVDDLLIYDGRKA